jgi:hypothetical protein
MQAVKESGIVYLVYGLPRINVSDLTTGTYIMIVTVNGDVKTYKILKD